MKKLIPRLYLVISLIVLVLIYVLLRMIPEDVIAQVKKMEEPLFIIMMLAGISVVFFIFVTALKKRISFVPNLCILFGIFGYLSSAFFIHIGALAHTSAHLLEETFLGIVCIAAGVSLHRKTGKYHFWISLTAIATLGSALLFIAVFAQSAIAMIRTIVTILCVIYLFGMIVSLMVAAKNIDEAELMMIPLVSCMLTASTVFGEHKELHLFSPEYVISLTIILITGWLGCKEFVILERSHRELRKNFEKELERQTGDLRNLLAEREKLLRFLSHDMRKPVVSIRRFLIEVIDKEQDAEQIKALNIIDMKVKNIEKSLTELAGYSKMAYVAEQSSVFSLMDILNDVYHTLKPDCDANGIYLTLNGADARIFGKPSTFRSVVTNLVMNAIEHASCTTIDITVIREREDVSIVVTDNGVGLEKGLENTIFQAYETTSSGEAHGLGLYICKSHMESMNGTITCVQNEDTLSFVLNLPMISG